VHSAVLSACRVWVDGMRTRPLNLTAVRGGGGGGGGGGAAPCHMFQFDD